MHHRLRTRTLPGLLLAVCLAGAALPAAAVDYGVQVGAFTDPANAERLRLRLLNQGYAPVQVLSLVSGNRDYNAVVVGRLSSQAEAAGLLNRLRGSFQSGFIRPLPEPTEPETAAPPAAPAIPAAIAPAPARPAAPAVEEAADSEIYQNWSGYAALETRVFPRDGRFPNQHDGPSFSLAFEPEYYREWDNGDQSFVFRPFLRLDQQDDERTHFDIRELAWIRAAEAWELRLGVRRVFWGVTETVHLVDIINQTDLVENTDTEDRLGQPMLNLALIRDWGTLDLFVLPGFRPRTFPGRDGRLRTQPWVDTEQVEYESGARHLHTDAAVRWS
ncbi:MAG TPA: SPOR domain-containing protein, partial [Arenicellales bacterium]|nr:SPOR domain-containing protein [Arenicellales bacterium]